MASAHSAGLVLLPLQDFVKLMPGAGAGHGAPSSALVDTQTVSASATRVTRRRLGGLRANHSVEGLGTRKFAGPGIEKDRDRPVQVCVAAGIPPIYLHR